MTTPKHALVIPWPLFQELHAESLEDESSGPTQAWVTEFDGDDFMAVPIMQITDDSVLLTILPLSQITLSDVDVALRDMRVKDGSSRPTIREYSPVSLEIRKSSLKRLSVLNPPPPVKLYNRLLAIGFEYLADLFKRDGYTEAEAITRDHIRKVEDARG